MVISLNVVHSVESVTWTRAKGGNPCQTVHPGACTPEQAPTPVALKGNVWAGGCPKDMGMAHFHPHERAWDVEEGLININ